MVIQGFGYIPRGWGEPQPPSRVSLKLVKVPLCTQKRTSSFCEDQKCKTRLLLASGRPTEGAVGSSMLQRAPPTTQVSVQVPRCPRCHNCCGASGHPPLGRTMETAGLEYLCPKPRTTRSKLPIPILNLKSSCCLHLGQRIPKYSLQKDLRHG